MGDGVSPEDGAMNLCDDENKKDEVFHDAEENGYASDAAGGRAAEKSMASANAEVPGTKAAEAEAGWTRVDEREVRVPENSTESRAASCVRDCADMGWPAGGGVLGVPGNPMT